MSSKEPTDIEWFAENGNGKDKPVNDVQEELIERVFKTIERERELLKNSGSRYIIDYEVCRRFLVARQWKEQKAIDQLRKMIDWRINTVHEELNLEDSPLCEQNPYALNMRCTGYDKLGR